MQMYHFKFLIIEDNRTFRQGLRERLQISFPGSVIVEATNGVEALEGIESFFPDIILMDLRLPGESGLRLTQKIKALYPDMTIFILTNYNEPECREAAFRYGADRFIPKESLNRIRLEELVKAYDKIE